MKIRSIKLREAHNASSGPPSFCSIIWDGHGSRLITSSAADPSVSVYDVGQLSKPAKELRHHKNGVTALALSPNSASLATGSIDHSVKIYAFPDGEFQNNVTRFTLPIRCLAFNKSGSLLAAAGDDDGIKLIATMDSTISKVLKGHKGPVTGLSFDPRNEYLASIDTFGTVKFWELSSGKLIHTLERVAPNCDSDVSRINGLSWSPNGEHLAVPGLKNEVVIYDRDTAEKTFTLKGDHEKHVCFLSWSPNGKYMATSALDKQILIWDVDLRQDIERHKFDDRICSFSWKPNGNALAVIDVTGKFGIWESAVPSCMKSPVDGVPDHQAGKTNGLLLFEEEFPSPSGSLDDANEESHDTSPFLSRKRPRKMSNSLDNSNADSDGDGEDGILRQIESRKRSSSKHKKHVGDMKEDSASSRSIIRSTMQEAFQPGSTPLQAGKRRFLAYNMLGSITTIENEGYSHIEVDFHDTGIGPRVPAMTDYFGFSMAALSDNGSVFANPCKGEKNMSTLMYRPFDSWATNSEWSMRFEGEEVKAVALGTGWVAAITSYNFLRIFTEGGLQRHILCLSGPVVTAVGYKDQLAIVTHASGCLPSGDQMLDVKVFNISECTKLIDCHLPLSPASCLAWFGFSEEGQLSSYDSKGVLRVFCHQYGGSWLPVFSTSKARKSEDESHWIVGLNSSKVFCIVSKTPDTYPKVIPKPVLELLSISFPLASSDFGGDDLENELIMSNLHLSEIQKNIEKLAAAGRNTVSLEDEAFDVEASNDRCILRLIASCCNGDKLVRAMELARLLSLEKSLKGAIKLVTALRLPMLAERFNEILGERLANGSKLVAAVPNVSINHNTSSSNAPSVKASTTPATKRSIELTASSSSTELPQPQFSKREKTCEKSNETGRTLSSKEASDKVAKISHNKTKLLLPTNPFAKTSSNGHNNEGAKQGGEADAKLSITSKANSGEAAAELVQSHRPVNPFLKTAKHQEASSFLQSMKRMKKVDQ